MAKARKWQSFGFLNSMENVEYGHSSKTVLHTYFAKQTLDLDASDLRPLNGRN